jgi:molecular chaperone HtpG
MDLIGVIADNKDKFYEAFGKNLKLSIRENAQNHSELAEFLLLLDVYRRDDLAQGYVVFFFVILFNLTSLVDYITCMPEVNSRFITSQ